jgi:Spy/CpxP family protein refolding chaperone
MLMYHPTSSLLFSANNVAAVMALTLFVSLAVLPASSAHQHNGRVDWDALELTPDQANDIQQLDRQWETTYQRIHPQIEKDQARLKELIEAPDTQPEEVMHVQNRLQRNRHQLHQSATRIFMKKKHRLNPPQRKQLYTLMQGPGR